MIDRGIVKEVKGDTARVEVHPHGGCPSCRNRVVCGGGRAGAFVMQADNRAGARPGDEVLLDMNGALGIASTLAVFVLPLLLCGGAAFLGDRALPSPSGLWVGLAVGIAATVFLLRAFNRAAERSDAFRPVIVRVERQASAI
jgi:sigma-E factor negative regulatory protein RseC